MHVLFTTFGSLGDLHPYMAIAAELKRRGYDATIATSTLYKEKIEAEGIGFAPLRPNVQELGDTKEVMKKVFDPRRGPEFVIRHIMMSHLRESYEDTMAAARGVDLLDNHALCFATPIVAEQLGLRWIATALAPLSLFSAFDPPVLPLAPGLERLRGLGPSFHRVLHNIARLATRKWSQPVRDLRRELGHPPSSPDPMYEGQFSPTLNLALFSRLFGPPQPDWPPNMVATGFPIYDRGSDDGMPRGLCEFLDTGQAPIVFTLGSSVVMAAGQFYAESARAARKLGRRAVLLTGADPANAPSELLDNQIAAFDYAPYSQLLPRAAAVVHQGGIGTTAQALRSGRPMLVVPHGFDQPDNAARVTRLGVGATIPPKRYQADVVADTLGALLASEASLQRATELGARIRSEDGAVASVDAIERLQ